jgi:lipopolysaccharide cholinephosphotransferase
MMMYGKSKYITYGEYEPEVLEKVHEKEMEMLRDFIYICDKHNIDYFVISGTAIGAVRHKGFIPWDDDIDIAMLRPDYHKFVKAANEEFATTFKDKYEMMGPAFEKKFYNMQPAMNMKGTKFVNDNAWAAGCDPGFFLDIFVYENVPEDEKEFKRVARICRLCEVFYIIRSVHYGRLIKEHSVKEWPKLLAYTVLGAILRLIPHGDDKIYKKYLKTVKPYYKKTDRYSAVIDTGVLIMDVHEDDIYPLVDMDFEDVKVKMVNKYDKQLKQHMGEDYMTIPPENKRTNHRPRIIDFGEGNA